MSTLTANRILEKGDEYRDNGTWKPVPSKELGLQVMFSKLKKFELRRPGEALKDFHAVPVLAEPPDISPNVSDCGEARESISPKTADVREADSRGGVKPLLPLPEKLPRLDRNGLPTVVSVRAHVHEIVPAPGVSHFPTKYLPPIIKGKAATITLASETVSFGVMSLKPLRLRPRWTGRNGSFNGYGVEVTKIGDNISIFPVGKRGVGNCEIQIPVSALPDFIRALDRVT